MRGRQRSIGGATILGLLTAASIGAQDKLVSVSRVDGAVEKGKVVSIDAGQLSLQGDGGPTSIPLGDVLAVHGVVPRFENGVTASLVGGDEIRGELRGGDPAGETVTIESRSLGSVSIAIDRLRAVVVRATAGGTGPSEFRIEPDAKHDEALFLPARRGFDTVFGVIHRFTADGVLFAPEGAAKPGAYGLNRIAAVAVRGGTDVPRKGAVLVTRAGDVVSVDVEGGDGDGVRLVGEGERQFTLRWDEVATLLFRGPDRLFLSELEPVLVEEAAALADDALPLFPWQRDRNVSGGFLVVGGRTYARGLGVHSRCVLTYEVPEGFDSFCTAVGIDDEVNQIAARADVDVAVLLDGKALVERSGVRGGAPVELGTMPVRAKGRLALRVDFGAGLDLGDRVDWLHAVLLKRRARVTR